MYPTQDSQPSCLRLIAQPARFNSSSIPPFRQAPDMPAEIQKYIPSLAVLTGNVLADQAQVNSAFTYLFNLVASQQYAGELWFQIVNFSAAHFWFVLQTRQGISVEAALKEAAGTAIMLKASAMAVSNAIVYNNLNVNVQNEVRAGAQEHERYKALFVQMVAQHQQQAHLAQNPAAAAGIYGGVIGNAMMSVSQQQPPAQNIYSQVLAQAGATGLMSVDSTQPGGGRLKTLVPRTAVKQDALSTYGVDQPQQTYHAPAQQQEQHQPTVTHISASAVTTAPVAQSTTTDAWRPSAEQLYKPALNDDAGFQLVYEKHTNAQGKPIVLAVGQLKDDAAMDEAQHRLPTLNRAMRDALAARVGKPAGDAVVSDLDLLAKGIRASRANEAPEVTEKLAAMGVGPEDDISDCGSGSVEDLIAASRIARLQEESEPVVFFTNGWLTHRVVTSAYGAAEDLFSKLANALTLQQVVAIINDFIDANIGKASELAFAAALGRYITNEVNQLLMFQMGLKGCYIDDVLQDLEELIKALQNVYGQLYSNAFRDYQTTFVKLLFNVESASLTSVAVNKDGEEKTVGAELVLSQDVGIALLSMDSSEFGVKLATKQDVYELFESNFPGLKTFAEAVSGALAHVSRVYVVTVDDVVFRVGRSIVGTKPVIIGAGN